MQSNLEPEHTSRQDHLKHSAKELLSLGKNFVLRVLSYNIHGLPTPIGIDHRRYKRIGEVLNERRQAGVAPHIVALQEAFHPRTDELIEASGYPYVLRGPRGNFFRTGSGLCFLSEFPILKSNHDVFSLGVGWDLFARKSVHHIQVQLPNLETPVDVLNTHLNSDPNMGLMPTTLTEWVKKKQAKELVKFIQRIWNGKSPVIFPGDFNFHPHRPDYQLFTKFAKIKNAAQEWIKKVPKDINDSLTKYFHTSYDHQFFIPGLNPAVKVDPIHLENKFNPPFNGRPLSDHDGLEIHYQFTW